MFCVVTAAENKAKEEIKNQQVLESRGLKPQTHQAKKADFNSVNKHVYGLVRHYLTSLLPHMKKVTISAT